MEREGEGVKWRGREECEGGVCDGGAGDNGGILHPWDMGSESSCWDRVGGDTVG